MNFEKRKFQYSNSFFFESLMPMNCPYCGKFTEPKILSVVSTSIQNTVYYFTCLSSNCCHKVFLTVHKKDNDVSEYLTMFPSFISDHLPDSIHKISPRFISLYEQSNFAESHGYIELAGSGYRNALEVLIKDYAINILGEDESTVSKKKLHQAIEQYLPTIDLKTAGDVIRILGNDFTHYERRYDISMEIFKKYLSIFISQIDINFLLRNPVVNVPDRQSDY